MPKAKPTQVIVHRIEFQEKERDILEMYAASKAINNLLEPAAAVGAVYVSYKVGKAAYGWGEDWFDGIKERMAKQKAGNYKEYENIFGLPGWGIWPGVI
jgi:hypothetical protein